MYRLRFGSRTSKIQVSTRPCFLWSHSGRILPCVVITAVAASSPRCSWLVDIPLRSLFPLSHGVLTVCLSGSELPSLLRTPVTGLGPSVTSLNPVRAHLKLIIWARSYFQRRPQSQALGVRTWTLPFWGTRFNPQQLVSGGARARDPPQSSREWDLHAPGTGKRDPWGVLRLYQNV